MSKGNVVLGTLAGLAIGATAGVLFAPEKGSTTRKQITDKATGYVDKLKSKVDGVRDSLSEKFDGAKRDAEELVDKGKEKYDEAKKEMKNAASNFKHDVTAEIKRDGNRSY